MKRIVIDIETTGLIAGKHQMVSLGAVNFDTEDTFYQECRILSKNQISPSALDINGFTVDQVRDPQKQTPLQLLNQFLQWVSCDQENSEKILLMGHNVGSFDLVFLQKIIEEENAKRFKKSQPWLKVPFYHRTIDLHTIAYLFSGQVLSLHEVCLFCGIEPEPSIHNALNGAMVTYQCLRKLMDQTLIKLT